jgi:hypothetical protein
LRPKPRHAETYNLIGDDGNAYTVHGYKEYHKGLPGEYIEGKLGTILMMDTGLPVMCMEEKPPTFFIERTGVVLRQRSG